LTLIEGSILLMNSVHQKPALILSSRMRETTKNLKFAFMKTYTHTILLQQSSFAIHNVHCGTFWY